MAAPKSFEEGNPSLNLENILRHRTSNSNAIRQGNPLSGLRYEELRQLARAFVDDHELGPETYDVFEKGSILAQEKNAWRDPKNNLQLSAQEKICLQKETTNKWDQPWQLYSMVTLASMCAAVQGWDETAVNGANTLYRKAFDLDHKPWIYGLVNSAPYLCCVISCWLTEPLNHWFGRRGAIMISCLISTATCLGQGFTQTWQQMFVARLLLGLGIGPKSATVPIYAAECAPASIRGSLVMMWQMWTAFGIMLGLAAGVVFENAGNAANNSICQNASVQVLLSRACSLNWRLMIASPVLLPVIVCIHVYLCPESPRWYMKKGRKFYPRAYKSLCTLRNSELQAARDLFYIHCLLQTEQVNQYHFVDLFTVPRNRRATIAAVGLMFLQQFCGVNIIAYYSTDVLFQANNVYSKKVLLVSLGFGIINFLFALPAVKTIDSFGRRGLLLTTFPLMALFMLFTGLGFVHPTDPIQPLVIVGMYLFGVVYSPGEGPVPFTYSAECFPLHIRTIGMAFATSVLWFFNFLLAITWPSMSRGLTTTGAFCFYSAWNIIGFFFILMFVPETKSRTLEELDKVFEIPTWEHAAYGIKQGKAFISRWLLMRDVEMPVLSCDARDRDDVVWSYYERTGEARAFPEDEERIELDRNTRSPDDE